MGVMGQSYFMLKTCQYELWALSSSGKPLNFTKFIISMGLNWSLNASRATSKIVMAPAAKKQLMNVRRGAQFLLRWGFTPRTYTKVILYWTGTIWELGDSATVTIDLVHGSWATTRVPIVGILSNAKVTQAATKAAKDKGVILDTKKAAVSKETKTIAIAQTLSEEIERQFKGQFIIPNKDGKTLEIVSFENISANSQAYYISTEYGYLDKISISYKAILPKDKSYIEMLGGEKVAANSVPNSNPSANKEVALNKEITPAFPTYAELLNAKDSKLVLYVDNQKIGEYKCLSTLSLEQKRVELLAEGQYTIAAKAIKKSNGELFLPLTPNFKSNRTQLGIHLSPLFIKKKQSFEAISLTSAKDREAVQKIILENKITILIVKNKEPDLNKIVEPSKVIKQSYLITDLNSNRIFAEQSKRGIIVNIGSMFKLFIAMAVINKTSDLEIEFQNELLKDLLKLMLDASSNEAANTLISYIGGIAELNNFCQARGFLKTKIDSNYTSELGLKQSTAFDLTNAFKIVFTQANYLKLRPFLSGSSLSLAGETHTKLGINSKFEGGISLVENTNNQKTIVCVLAENNASVRNITKSISQFIP